jgi:hypothetical protein
MVVTSGAADLAANHADEPSSDNAVRTGDAVLAR